MEQTLKTGHDRRSFLRNAGLSGGVLALGPLAASLAASSEASAAPMDGRYDFDTPYNRLGFDDVKWDGAVRTEHMSHIVAGMGIADMDFRCAPVITEALRKRIQHENWGYMDMGFARSGRLQGRAHQLEQEALRHHRHDHGKYRHHHRRSRRHHGDLARLCAARLQGADGDADL